uniref:Discs large MAGUK scaffold protein 5 n=1 Tax=Cyclopterus lumpus TaxID=8103 RepID=A0A8C2Z8C6_CYCLU
MEPKHKELLEKCYQNLVESITDADRVVDVLAHCGTLSQSERYELGHNCSSNSEKVALLLKILISKDRDHFAEFCTALEKLHPHLHSVLLNGTGPVDHTTGTPGQASSPPPAHMDSHQVNEKMETVLFQLRHVTRERDELRKRLALSSPGTTFDDCRPNSKAGHDYERLKLQCMKAMADLQSLQNQHSSTLKRCEEAVKKADFYHTLHSRLASEQAQLKEELEAVRGDNIQLVREHNHVKQACEELRRLRDDDQREVAEMRILHQQVMREGASDVLNKLYDTTVDKLEALKSDYEALRKHYNEKTAGHNADLSRLDQAEEENHRLQKQLDMLLKQRDAAIHYQQQYSSSIRRFDNTQQELSKATAQNKELQREMDRLQSEATRQKTQQLKAVKDSEKYREERDSVINEYRLIMSERDQVIKEVDRLQTGLEMAEAKLKNTSSERRVASEELEALRQKQDSATLDMERANKEIDILRKQYEAVSQELKEAVQEAEVAKCRRDWAFQERDKIVAERESIRTLCDNLRRERDRAVSDLADALRNLDDTRKQKNDAARELKELKEKMEDQLEKEARFRQLMVHSSHDSAIDTDSMEWETEVVEFEKHRVRTTDMDLKALGFDIAEGVNDPYLPGDCGIFVSKVDKGSIAEGRLRVNDWLLKMNDVDLTNKDRKQVIKAVLSGEGLINLVVRRRKSLGGRIITPIQMNLAGHKDSGIGLESGVFVATLSPGSPAARDCALTVGDRLLAINGIALDNKSLSECESLLRNCRDSLSISLMKFLPQSYSGQSLFEGLRDSEKISRLQPCEMHTSNCRNSKHNCSKHNCSTQTDICSCDLGGRGDTACKDTGDSLDSSGGGNSHCHHKPFSNSSLHSRSLSNSHSPLEPHPDVCYRRQELHHRPFTFTPVLSECISPQTVLDRLQSSTAKPSGGTWPKVITEPSIPECAQLSIYKKVKQRKSIFEVNAFRRPEASSKADYMSLSHLPKHSPPSSISESAQTPPTPPARSDSFRFKHRQQNSSASDSTITTSTPPTTPAQATSPQDQGEAGDPLCYPDAPPGEAKGSSKKTAEEGRRHRVEERQKRRYRPKSAPALRRNVTPLHIPVPIISLTTSTPRNRWTCCASRPCGPIGTACPLHPPATAASRHVSHLNNFACFAFAFLNLLFLIFMSDPVLCVPPDPAQRGLAPCPAVTAVMRNPVYTAWSHEIQTNNCPPASSSGHQGCLSLDLSHKRTGDQPPHSTNSLPSCARLGSSSALQIKAERIKIPPTRYPRSTGSDKGSLSHSECSSPTPPTSPVNLETSSFTSCQSQSSISTQPRISVSPAPVGDRRKDGPYLEEPRNVIVQKGAEPLGISIVSGENGGVFVSKVTAGSIAHQACLEYGDQLLEFNGINLRNANEQQARLVIGQQCDTVTILAQYNPHMVQLGNHSRSGNQPTNRDSGATTPDSHCPSDTLSEQDEGTMTPPSKQTTPPRLVRLKRIQVELGVQICGGNLYGIFVESLDDESPAKGPEGLLLGDLILEYNGISMKNKTKEDAYLEMLKPAETITFKVQNCVDNLSAIKESPGDGFFIRALYERVAEVEQELGFKKDDILYVEDTLPNGNFGYWMAWQLDENAQKLEKGQIPSKYMMDQEFYKRHSMADMKDDNGTSKTLSAAARRSFFRRRLKHKRSGSKDGKDLMTLDAISIDSLPITEGEKPSPELILQQNIMKASQQAIERGVKDCVFIDYKRRSGHFDVTTVASIKEITEKDCHCLLDIAPHAIERLHSVHIYPIVIFIRYKNAKQIKEQKDPLYLRDKLSQKHSKEQYEAAQKIEQEYSRFFTGVVQGGSVAFIYTQIMTIVEQEQSKVLWIPDGAL